jgi:hypothetical protein
MDVRREELRAGLHRAKGVLNWQGIPENHPVRESLHHFRKIVVELDRCFEDASREQLDALRDAYDRVSRSLPELLRNRSEDELSTREAEIIEVLLDTAKRHAEVWLALRAKIEASYATLTARAAAGHDPNVGGKRKRAGATASAS